ncbi:hypothetical protein [Spirosoma jeollabukense]
MERFLTTSVASLCAAPLFFRLTLQFVEPLIRQRLPDGSGASLDRSLLFSLALTLFGFVLVAVLAWYFSGHGYLRPVQMITCIMLAGWSLAGVVFFGKEPRKLDYDGQRAVLEAEVRIDSSLLGGRPASEVVALSYTGGDFDTFHLDRSREEGKFIVLPWEITVHTVYTWAVWSTIANKKSYFPMTLPYRPGRSTSWSAWEAPKPHPYGTTPEGISLRYRLLVLPQVSSNP